MVLQQQHHISTHQYHLPPPAAAALSLRPRSTSLIPQSSTSQNLLPDPLLLLRSSSDIPPSSVDIVDSSTTTSGRFTPLINPSGFGSVQKPTTDTATEYIFSSDITTVSRELDSCGIVDDGKLCWIRDPFSAGNINEVLISTGLGLINRIVDGIDYYKLGSRYYVVDSRSSAYVSSSTSANNPFPDSSKLLHMHYVLTFWLRQQLLAHHADYPDQDPNTLALPIFIATTLLTSPYSLNLNHLLRINNTNCQCVDRSNFEFRFSQMLGNQKTAMLNSNINGDNQICQREDDADVHYGLYDGGDCSWPANYVGCRDDHRLQSQQLVMDCLNASVLCDRDTRLTAAKDEGLTLSEARLKLPESKKAAAMTWEAKQVRRLGAEMEDVKKSAGGGRKQAKTVVSSSAMPKTQKYCGGGSGARSRDLFKCTSFQLCERWLGNYTSRILTPSASRPPPKSPPPSYSSSAAAAAVNYREGSRQHHHHHHHHHDHRRGRGKNLWAPWRGVDLVEEEVSKKKEAAFGELTAAVNGVAATLAGAGLALILFVASRMLGVHATLDSTKLSYLMRGMGLLWLSSAVKNLASAAHLSALSNRRSRRRRGLLHPSGFHAISATYFANSKQLHAVTFRMCFLVILTIVRLA